MPARIKKEFAMKKHIASFLLLLLFFCVPCLAAGISDGAWDQPAALVPAENAPALSAQDLPYITDPSTDDPLSPGWSDPPRFIHPIFPDWIDPPAINDPIFRDWLEPPGIISLSSLVSR